MLGFLCQHGGAGAYFTPTSSFSLRNAYHRGRYVLDSRDGHVLLVSLPVRRDPSMINLAV